MHIKMRVPVSLPWVRMWECNSEGYCY